MVVKVYFFYGIINEKEDVAENCYGGIKAIVETRFLQIFIFSFHLFLPCTVCWSVEFKYFVTITEFFKSLTGAIQ